MNARHSAPAVKPRPAAALALVGWYLMLPRSDINAPLNTWVQMQSFDSAADCQTYRAATIANFDNGKYSPSLRGNGASEVQITGFGEAFAAIALYRCRRSALGKIIPSSVDRIALMTTVGT
jgi:hypothetical protein